MARSEPSVGYPGDPGNVRDLNAKWHGPKLRGPDGPGGGGGDMEQRVASVERRLDAIDGKLGALSTDLAELKGKVSMLPGYGGIALIVGVIVGLSTIAQVAAKFIPSIPAP